MNSIGIGALAKRAGVRIDTVRYEERSGLLTPKSRLVSEYRRFSELERVRGGLATLMTACPGHGGAADWPDLHALGGETSR